MAYDGTGFAGWATQPGLRTVQDELETWLTRILRLDGPVRLVCAGRTDAGVHARGQVLHLDLPVAVRIDPPVLVRRLRRALPGDVAVTAVRPAPPHFDARFGAIWRRYCYRIADAAARPDPLLRHQVLDLAHELDVVAINTAAQPLLGLREFAAFCRHRPDATTIRTLLDLSAERVRVGPYATVIEVTVRADAFCHSMVRSLVGALAEVGSGRRDPGWLHALLRAQTREPSVPVLAARGLTLEEVGYPPDLELQARVRAARSRRVLSPAERLGA